MRQRCCVTQLRGRAAVLAGLLALLVLYSHAAIAQEVVLHTAYGDQVTTEVCLKDPATGKKTRFLTISGIYTSHYHPAEYRNGYLYVIKRQGQTSAYSPDTSYIDELWRYSADGEGHRLLSLQGLDFRASNDGSRIAITGYPDKTNGIKLYIIRSSGVVIESYSKGALNAIGLTFGGWVGGDLWIRDQEAVDIYGLIRIDTNTLKAQRYDLKDLDLADSDLSFNLQSLKLAYSDYPVLFDTDSEADFVKDKTPVKLYVYDLKTHDCKQIAHTTAKPFNPKWLNESTLQYDSSKGGRRVKVTVK